MEKKENENRSPGFGVRHIFVLLGENCNPNNVDVFTLIDTFTE